MDVLMPDGTTITGVPEGITQSELLARYNKFSAAKPEAASGLASLAKPEPILSPEEQMMGFIGAASAPQERLPRPPEGQFALRPYEPSLTDQLMELLPGNKYKAANEYAARQIAKERGVPVGEIYKDIGGARPMFNPEGRAPIRAGVEAAKITAQELPKVPEATLSTFLKAYRAGDIEAPADAGMVDKAIAAMKPTDAKGKPDPNYDSFLGLGESLGFSVATMVASLTAAAAGEVVAGPVGGVSAGMAASGAMAYRASKDDFLSRVRDKLNGESQKLYGTNISPEDWNKAKQEYNQAAVEYGAWEAIPEAVSNAVFIKAFASPVKTGRGAAKMNSLIEKVGSQGVEQATETMTALGQNAAEMKAGLSDEELTIADAFRQQFIQTLLIGGTMAGGMKAKEVGDKFYREVVEPRVRPSSALAKAIQSDVDAVAFNPESTRRAAVEALNPNRAKEQVVAEPGIASLIQKQQIAMPPPPKEPEEEILAAPPSKSQDMDAMLREALGEPAPTIPVGIVNLTPTLQEPEAVVEKPAETVFTAPSDFAYSITQSPAYGNADPLSVDDAQFELDVLLENAKRGRLTPQRFVESEIGRRLDTAQIMAINDGIRNNPIATIEALIQKVAPAKAPAAEAPKAEPTLKEQYDKAAKLNLMAPDAFRDRRINQEQYDQIQADYERIKTKYQASIPKATLTPIQQEATDIANGLEELGQTSFVTGMRSAIERNQVNKDNLEFYRSRLKQEQAKQNALDEGIERPSEKFEWTKFFRDDPKDLNKLKLFNSKAPPAVKQALQTVTDTLQALTNRLNDEGYTMYGTPNSTVPQEIKNLRSQIQMRSAGGVKLINAFEALDKGFNRSKKTTNQQNLDAAIQDIKVDAAEAQKVLQRSIPEPEEIVNARGTLAEARKQMDTLAYKSGSLWSALSGKLDPEEVREIFGKNPSLGNKKLGVTKKSGLRGTYISELAANGLLDTFLPPKMRHKSDMFDAAESAQYIKDAVANKDYLPHDVKEEIENIQKAVGPLGDLIDEYLTIEEQNRELQIAFDEQREADQAAEIVEPESEDRAAEPSERPAGELKLTAATPDEIRAKVSEIDRLTKENERLSKEVERKAKADEEAKDFVLTGSNREADQAAARGQKDIFAEAPAEEAPVDNKQEIADLRKEQKALMMQIVKAGMEETPVQEARMAEIEKRIAELEGKPAKPEVKQRSAEEIEEELQNLQDELDGEILKEKRKPLIEKLSKLEGELAIAEGRAARAAAEEAAEEAIRNKAEAEIDEGPIGQAIAKIENGEFEFQEDSSKVMERKPSAEVAEEVLPAAEEEVAGELGFEPYTMEGEFTEIGEERQQKILTDQTSKLSEDQTKSLESQYGAKRGSTEFLDSLRKDIIAFINEGAKAVNGKIRAIIRQMAAGVMSAALVLNPMGLTNNFEFNLPKTYKTTVTTQVKAEVPANAKAKMSTLAQSVYESMAPTAEASGKGFIIADKPNGMMHVFFADGSMLVQDTALYGKDIGDVESDVSSLGGGPKITPAGKFTLVAMPDAEYAGGVTLGLSETANNGIIAVHAAYLGNPQEKRLERLATPGAEGKRISYGCINTAHKTFLKSILPNIDALNGGMIFVLPDNQTATAAMFPAKTKTTTTEQRVPAPKTVAERKQAGREERFFSIEGKKLPPGRSPELAAAAQQVKAGTMTAAEFDKLVNKYRPITPYEKPLKPATTAQMVDALSSDKKDKVNPDIPEGTRVGLRLDIPAFNRKGVYVVTIHEKGNASGPGKAIGYDSVAVINNVNFGTGSQKKALNIATGEAKDALQTMEGEFVKSDPASVYAAALKAMDDPSWTQIGVDPARHTYFYDRNTTQPVIAADQVIQIGNTVLAKNVTYGRKEDFLYNFEDDMGKLVDSTVDKIDETEKKRSPSLIRKIKTLTNQRNQGKLTDKEYIDRVNSAIDEDYENDLLTVRKSRVRGADFIREKLLNAKRNGFLSEEAVDLAEWFIGQNPDLVDDLGISIKAKGPSGAGGFYNAMARVITLIKERGSDLTTLHEILHHLERMMPAKIQAAIRKAWLTQLLKANKAATDPAQKLYFMALLDAHIGNNNHTRLEIPEGSEGIYKAIVEQMKFANELTGGRGADPKSSALARELLLYSPTVPSELYEYFDPSEFWAVNGSDIVRARYDAVKGGVLARLKNWLREFAEKVKSLFGMKSDASIIRALDSLAKSDGKYVTDEMLGTGDYQNIKKNAFGGEMPEATWAMRESTFGNDWMQRWQDNYRDLKNVQKSITEQIGKIDDRLNAYRKQTVNPGREAERQGDFVKYEVDPLVKEMIANKVSNQELATYLHNRYAEERNEIINAKNKNKAVQNQGSGISTEKARTYMEALPADRAKVLESLAKRIDAIVRGSQDLLVQSGQETQETIDGWRQSSPHYVPLQRDEFELDFIVQTGTGSLGGYATAGKFGKEAIGSTKTVKNILENVMLQRDRAIRRAESIRIGQALYGMAIQHPNPDFWMAINPDAVNDIDALMAEMEEMGLDPELIKNILEQPKTGYVKKSTGPEGEAIREVKYRVDRAYQNAKNVFPIRINGQNRYVLFNPKSPEALRLAAELKSLNPEQLNLFFGVASSFSRWFAAVNTQYNPVFGLVNFWNDTQGALINLSTTPLNGKQSTVLKNVLPAMHGIARDIRKERKQTVKSPIKTAYGKEIDSTDWTNLWRLYRNGGGKTAFRDQMVKPKLNVEWKGMMPSFSYTDAHTMLEALEKIEQGPISKKVEWWADCFSDFNDTLENTVRLAVFKVGYVDMKLPLEEAIDIAKNITVDFNRRGGRTKNVRGMYVFFNAALQSNARIAVTLAGPAGKTIVKAGLAMGALNAMWMFLAGFDDDDPPQFTRNKGFVVPTGDGDYFLWNLPQGWRAIPNTGRLVTEGVLVSLGLMKSNKGMAGKISDASGVVFDAINPFGGGTLLQTLAPTFLDPGMALAENKDSFGRPIFKEDQSLKPTPGWQRTRDSASTFSKGLSWLLNYVSSGGEEFDKGFLSPTGDQIDYLISQAAGGFARDVKRTGEWAYNTATGEETPSYRKPVLNRFIGEIKTDAAASARFYDNVTMLARYENVINGRIENKGDVQGYLKENPIAKFAFVANDFENEVSSINRTIRDLQNMDETPARKQQIKDLKASRVELMKNFNNMVRQAQ